MGSRKGEIILTDLFPRASPEVGPPRRFSLIPYYLIFYTAGLSKQFRPLRRLIPPSELPSEEVQGVQYEDDSEG